MRSSQTIGEACPLPGISVFQAIFSPRGPFQCSGRFFSRLLPSPRGPRQPGQFSARASPDGHDTDSIDRSATARTERACIARTGPKCMLRAYAIQSRLRCCILGKSSLTKATFSATW